MGLSRSGTILTGVAMALGITLVFQNCAPTGNTSRPFTDKNVTSLSTERSRLDAESTRLENLIAQDLTCSVDAECEILVLARPCEEQLASSTLRTDRDLLKAALKDHADQWTSLSDAAAAYPELSWMCPMAMLPQATECHAGQCRLRD